MLCANSMMATKCKTKYIYTKMSYTTAAVKRREVQSHGFIWENELLRKNRQM
jgi:hypothetical protein